METVNKKTLIVLGSTGVGKSSAVNMILGREAAKISDAAIGCTFDFQCYSTQHYDLYDTVGLSEGSCGTITAKESLSCLIGLLKSLKNGVDLLIFVIKKEKITKSTEDNYKLFVKGICMDEVPVLLLITHCEFEVNMGDWWTANKMHFDTYGMEFAGAISGCITRGNGLLSVPALEAIFEARYSETQKNINAAIPKYVRTTAWKMKSWLGWFSKIAIKVYNVLSVWFNWRRIPFLKELCNILVGLGIDRDTAIEMANDVAASL